MREREREREREIAAMPTPELVANTPLRVW